MVIVGIIYLSAPQQQPSLLASMRDMPLRPGEGGR